MQIKNEGIMKSSAMNILAIFFSAKRAIVFFFIYLPHICKP